MVDRVELDLTETNERLLSSDAEGRIRWAVEAFGRGAVLLSSMQKTASVLMHLFHRMGLDNEVLFVDTGYHFPETLRLRDAFMRRYRLNLVTLYPDLTPEQQEKTFEKKLYLYVDGQKECCRLRKTVPYINHMRQSAHRLTMVGLRRTEGGRRSRLEPLTPDPRIQGYTLHPICDWTDEQIERYLADNDVPEHPLHKQSYPSIGCECCTTPVAPGEDPRAGRWRHLREPGDDGPKYCNINFSDGSGI
jgi:phosphoadenosine phosphosulfate reductase